MCEAAAEIFPEEDIGNFAHSVVDYEVYKTKGAFLKHVRPQSVLDYLNEHDIKSSVIVAEGSHSDLLAGVYEGGLKVWECTFDLLDYLENESVVFRDTNVLDLGCGAGLLGIYALDKGATTVVFQDYVRFLLDLFSCCKNVTFQNKEVLRYATIPNALLNGCSAEKFRCFSGDWEWFSGLCKEKFDIILTSETIYNNRNYVKLVDVFKKFLKEGGVMYPYTSYFSSVSL